MFGYEPKGRGFESLPAYHVRASYIACSDCLCTTVCGFDDTVNDRLRQKNSATGTIRYGVFGSFLSAAAELFPHGFAGYCADILH